MYSVLISAEEWCKAMFAYVRDGGGPIMISPQPGLLFTSTSNAKGQTDKHLNILKREALYFHDPSGKVKISFRSKHEAAGGAGEE